MGAKPQMDRKHPLVLSPEWVLSQGTRDDHSPHLASQYFFQGGFFYYCSWGEVEDLMESGGSHASVGGVDHDASGSLDHILHGASCSECPHIHCNLNPAPP